ncbi:hypothetical protein SMA75_20355 [Escherichia coli]|uniref:hypothetical protein n=1 Tax=Escherichia coli TaxID=562 RepID=UPI003078F074
MRVIEKNMVAAIKSGREWKQDNTEVIYSAPNAQGWECPIVRLHGHVIAKGYNDIATGIASWQFTLAGWNTPTTRSRITSLMQAFSKEYQGVRTERGQAIVLRRDGSSFPIANDEWVG